MSVSAVTGTWCLKNGVIFVDLKIKHPNLPDLKNIKLSAIAHINSAGNLILHWDTAVAETVRYKINHKITTDNNVVVKKFQYYYDSNNCLYLLQKWNSETFTPRHQKFEISDIFKTSQLEYRRLPNEDHDKKISPMPAVPENAVKASSYGSLCASHILIKVPKNSDGDKELNKANAIYAQLLLKPEKFGDFAAKYSDCPSKTKNGYLGYFEKGQMVPEFEEATLALKENQISKPIKTSFGWHIIKREKL